MANKHYHGRERKLLACSIRRIAEYVDPVVWLFEFTISREECWDRKGLETPRSLNHLTKNIFAKRSFFALDGGGGTWLHSRVGRSKLFEKKKIRRKENKTDSNKGKRGKTNYHTKRTSYGKKRWEEGDWIRKGLDQHSEAICFLK